jgi:hypothetical protein
MSFAYYERLSQRQQRVYRRSDGIHAVPLPRARELAPRIDALAAALQAEERLGVEVAADG